MHLCGAACAVIPQTEIQKTMYYLGNSSLTIAPKTTRNLDSNFNVDSISVSSLDNPDICFSNMTEDMAFKLASSLKLDINSDDYNCSIKSFPNDDATGVIVFDYKVGENIISNKAYSIIIENGKVTEVFSNNADKVVNKNLVAKKFEQLNNSVAFETTSLNCKNVVDTVEKFFYDCSTEKLTYSHIVFTEENGAIVENVFETAL